MGRKLSDAGDNILAEINSRLKEPVEPDTRVADSGPIVNKISRAVMEVSKEIGSGFAESVYEKALMVELKNQGLRARNHVPVKVRYKGVPVGEYYAHIIVEDQVILELKMVDELLKVHKTQLINCLKATGYKVGLLVNFANDKAEIRRFNQ
jgi:GxxExxY protein